MAISKKSLGKVLAISMASAMAMSSLSAALVSVSAVQNPALASNGQVEFAELDGKTSAEGVIATFFNGMSDIDDDIVDVMAGGKIDLNDLTNALKASAGFVFTDNDGLEVELTGVEYEYKVTSGTSYLKYYNNDAKNGDNKGCLVAQSDKSGSATLQIKITGYADIGGGRDDKKVTMTQNVKFDVHKENEVGLEAYKAAADKVNFASRPVTEADLNDLAAYGETVTFCVVQYTKADLTAFFATISPVKGGGYTPVDPDHYATKDQQIEYVQTQVRTALQKLVDDDKLTQASLDTFVNTTLLKLIDQTGDKVIALNAEEWNKLKGTDIQGAVEAGKALYKDTDADVKAARAEYTKDGSKKIHEIDGKFYGDKGAADITLADEAKTPIYSLDGKDAIMLTNGTGDTATKSIVAEVVDTAKKLDLSDDLKNEKLEDAVALIEAQLKTPVADWANVVKDADGNYYAKNGTMGTLKVTLPSSTPYTEDATVTKALSDAANGLTAIGGSLAEITQGSETVKYLAVTLGTTADDANKDFSVKVDPNDKKSLYDLDTQTAEILYSAKGDGSDYAIITSTYKEGYKLTEETTDPSVDDLDTKFGSDNNYTTDGTNWYYIGKADQWSNPVGSDGKKFFTDDTLPSSTTDLNVEAGKDAVDLSSGTVKTAYKLTFDGKVMTPGKEVAAFKEGATAMLYKDSAEDKTYNVAKAGSTKADVQKFQLQDVVNKNAAAIAPMTIEKAIAKDTLDGFIQEAPEKAIPQQTKAAFVLDDKADIEGIRFYAGSGQDLFEVADAKEDWVRGTKGGNKGCDRLSTGRITLATNGEVGSGSIKVAVNHNNTTDELVLNVKTVKAVNFGGNASIDIDKSGSKTLVDNGDNKVVNNENISGFEIRGAKTVSMENGNVGCIKDATAITISGGKVASIDAEDAVVSITEDGVVGDILNATSVTVDEGGQAGNITADANVSLTEGTIASINVDGTVDINGGTVSGNITATGNIDISSNEDDTNDDPLDTQIGGNVTLLAQGGDSKITINNESDEGAASLTIRGNVVAKHVDTSGSADDATVSIGDSNTTGLIQISGIVEGEVIQLGGNGLVSLAGVRAANEIERNDNDGETIESTIVFDGFNSAIAAINNFADVKVTEGTVIVKGAVNATNLTVNSDAQIVADSIAIEEDIMEGGSIVVPVGKLTVTGSVDDSPSLALTGELAEGTVAFIGNRGLVDKFETGGITLKAEKLANGNYNYLISKVELNGLTAIGKDVATGVKQEKKVSVALDGTLPEGASIVWESDDADIATVTGNGTEAVITGEDVGTTAVTAKIVDANGRELGYEDASFDVNVLDNATVDSIGGDIGPDDNQVDLDTKKKNMEAGQVYTFMVRGNNDVENISVTSGDTNVATVALANGTDSRGALYNITAVADGKTDITVTYQGKTSKIAVKVGGFQLDTSSKKMAPGQVYSVLAKNVPADQAGNVTLAYDNNIVDVVKVNDNYNGRGVLFNVTAKAIGETEVKVTHNGETETMAVNVVENTGRLTLDTASYTMPFGGNYTIGVKVEKNGRQLSGEEVRAMITSGELVVTDSRTGSIVTTEVQANGNVRVTGRQNEGTTYVQFIVMQNGQRVTHASVGVTVQNGATAGGSSVRSISQW